MLFQGFTGFGSVFSLAFAGLLVIAAYSGNLNPQNHHPAFIFLNLALPYLLMLNLAIALCWLLIRQWRIALITVAAIALSWQSVWTVFPLNFFSKKAANSENTFSVMTYNLNYFAYNNSRSLHEHNDILDYIFSKNPDIVLMQESIDVKFENMPSLSKADIDTLRSRYPYYTKVSNSDPSILSKHPFKIQKSLHIMKSKQYPVVSIYTVNIKGKEITFVNCHLQSNGLSSGDKSLLRNFMSQDSINNMSLAHKVKNSVLAKVVEASSLRAEQAL